MTISVLIAAYKAGPYIASALESVRSQTYADWELIVVEDGSRDETEAIVTAFAAKVPQPVRYENLGTNQGVAIARNRLMELARGAAVAFIDADDLWDPHHLQRGAERLAHGADLVATGVITVDLASGRELERILPPDSLESDPVGTLFRGSVIVTSSCVFLRTTKLREIGGFDRTLRVGEDRDYWLRIGLAGGRFALSREMTCRYSKHAQSTMHKTMLVAEQVVMFYEKYQALDSVPPALRKQSLARSLESHGRLLRAKDPRRSAHLLARAWRLQPANLALGAQWSVSAVKSVLAGRRN